MTFIGDSEPNQSVDRIVAQAAEAIRSEARPAPDPLFAMALKISGAAMSTHPVATAYAGSGEPGKDNSRAGHNTEEVLPLMPIRFLAPQDNGSVGRTVLSADRLVGFRPPDLQPVEAYGPAPRGLGASGARGGWRYARQALVWKEQQQRTAALSRGKPPPPPPASGAASGSLCALADVLLVRVSRKRGRMAHVEPCAVIELRCHLLAAVAQAGSDFRSRTDASIGGCDGYAAGNAVTAGGRHSTSLTYCDTHLAAAAAAAAGLEHRILRYSAAAHEAAAGLGFSATIWL